MTRYDYTSETAKRGVLYKLNRAEGLIAELQRKQKEIDKQLKDVRLCLVYARTVTFGPGKGKTGRINTQ
jgi:hypothetical protein